MTDLKDPALWREKRLLLIVVWICFLFFFLHLCKKKKGGGEEKKYGDIFIFEWQYMTLGAGGMRICHDLSYEFSASFRYALTNLCQMMYIHIKCICLFAQYESDNGTTSMYLFFVRTLFSV